MSDAIVIIVHGNPLPKQSFRASRGGGYTDPRIKAWQDIVSWKAHEAMIDRSIFECPVEVWITFWRKDYTRADADNLSKACLDSLNHIVYSDDNQVIDLHIQKRVDRNNPGCRIQVTPASDQNITTLTGEQLDRAAKALADQ